MKFLFIIFLLLAGASASAQSWDFGEKLGGNTKQTMLLIYTRAENPNLQKGLLVVIDTIIPVYQAKTSGQFYFERDTTINPHLRHYLGFETNMRIEYFSVFSDKSKTEHWIWTVNKKGELEKCVAPEWLFSSPD